MKKPVEILVVLGVAMSWGLLATIPSVLAADKKDKDKNKQGQQGQQPAAAQVLPEHLDIQAIQNELDPDRQIQLVRDFEQKYPSSQFLTHAYALAAVAATQKNDVMAVLEFGQKSLKLKEDNLQSLFLVATMLPMPQSLQGSDVEKEKKLMDAETYANRALQLIEQLPKQTTDTDELHQKRKNALSGEMHKALGMVHLQRSTMGLAGLDQDELAKAEQEFKLAASVSDPPSFETYFRLGEVYAHENKLDEAIDAFTKAAQIGEGVPQLKPIAEERIEAMKKRKAQAKPPAKP